MKILGYEVIIRKIGNGALDNLRPADVERQAKQISEYSFDNGELHRKIARIKAVRILAPGTSLGDAKDWVEARHW